jgi:hypothetical protein
MECAFLGSSISRMIIPSSCEFIGSSAFASISSLSGVLFAQNSQLKRIESSAFSSSGLRSILIPTNVAFLGSSCFASSKSLTLIKFEPNCQVSSLSLDVISGTSVSEICIPSNVRLLESTTTTLPGLKSVTFEKESQLARIESAFFGSSITLIDIPKSVECLSKDCFRDCKVLETVEFDNESQLQHVDKSAFSSSSVKLITVPSRISALFSCVVPPGCELRVVKVQQQREFNLDEWKITLNEYEEVGELNSGGTVRLFKHRSTKEEIVVKAFPFVPYANSPSAPEVQFRRELETMITLRHPCVVQMRGWCPAAGGGDGEKFPQIVLEYLRPPSLKTLLDKPGEYDWWTSTAKAKAIVGIVQAMSFLHSRNLMHRELKTRIVLLDDEHQVKIGGFGRSKFDDADLQMKQTSSLSTSLYQAPEMWEYEYTNSVDVYSFAMILYRMMMNHSPFPELRRRPPVARMRHVQSGKRPPIDDGVVPFMRALIGGCWSEESTARPSFPKIMEILDHEDFKVFPDVDSGEVRRYVEMIRVKSQLL